jgi:hypothetical protein
MALTGLRGIGKPEGGIELEIILYRRHWNSKSFNRVRREEITTCRIKDRIKYREENYN